MSTPIDSDSHPATESDRDRAPDRDPAPDAEPETGPESGPSGKRVRLIAAVLVAFAAAGAAYGVYWYRVARFEVVTDDAYVNGNVVQITPQVDGTVVAIKVHDTQRVRAGDTLVELDRADADVALERSQADLGSTVRDVRQRFAEVAQLRAEVRGRAVDLTQARTDLHRREHLAASHAISREDVQHARDAVDAAQAALAAARERLTGSLAETDRTTVASHPDVQAAAAKLRSAYLDYQRAVLPAPVSGYVAQRQVQLGQRVSPGTALMAIVPLDEVWVDANFKEGQLADIRLGDPVTLIADANGVTYHGSVVGLGAGTGAAFALLPAQNATGNWIKVVQRLPVRIALDSAELHAHPLAIGLSMEVTVDVHPGGRRASTPPRRAGDEDRTAVYARQSGAADALIADIIARNGGAAEVAADDRAPATPTAAGALADSLAGNGR